LIWDYYNHAVFELLYILDVWYPTFRWTAKF